MMLKCIAIAALIACVAAAGFGVHSPQHPDWLEHFLREEGNRWVEQEKVHPVNHTILIQNIDSDETFGTYDPYALQQEQWLSAWSPQVRRVSQVCGNGEVELWEQCDVGSAATTCAALGLGLNNPLITVVPCDTTTCTWSLLNCAELCGDGNLDPASEQCDNSVPDLKRPGPFNGHTCGSVGLGFTGGNLACDANCKFVFTGCTTTPDPLGFDRCGDGKLTGLEQCDFSTTTAGVANPWCGTCSPTCDINYATGCPLGPARVCGDFTVDAPEECDGDDLDGKTCETLGFHFTGGRLGCTEGCRFNVSHCTRTNGFATVIAIGGNVTKVHVGDVIMLDTVNRCVPFDLNAVHHHNPLNEYKGFCLVQEEDVVATLSEGNLFSTKANHQQRAGYRRTTELAGPLFDRPGF